MADYHKAVLDELQSDLATVEDERSMAVAALEKIDLRYSQIKAAVALLEEKIRAAVAKPSETHVFLNVRDELVDVYVTMSMPEAIRHCLLNSPNPLSKRELMVKLREGGKEEGNHFSQGVYNTLYRLSKNGGQVRQDEAGRWSWVEHAATGAADHPGRSGNGATD